jgi:hypothetical protein
MTSSLGTTSTAPSEEDGAVPTSVAVHLRQRLS